MPLGNELNVISSKVVNSNWEMHPLYDGVQAIVNFPNGYSASVVRHSGSYGTELAVLYGNDIVYDTPITDDVIGWLTPDTLESTLKAIAELPAR